MSAQAVERKPAAVRERGIIFSAPMVRALLEGRKTQTRRLVKPPLERVIGFFASEDEAAVVSYAADGHAGPGWYVSSAEYAGEGAEFLGVCPYGVPGDRLWVRGRHLVLELTDVRAQRLQDISEEDAKAEGVQPLQMDHGSFLPRFQGLWDSIYDSASWDANPWVWALTFRVLP